MNIKDLLPGDKCLYQGKICNVLARWHHGGDMIYYDLQEIEDPKIKHFSIYQGQLKLYLK